MRKFSVVCAFALLLINPCVSIATTTQTTKISSFCRDEFQKTSPNRIPWLNDELFSMILKGQVELSIAQINRIFDIALQSKNQTLSSELGFLLGDDLFWRESLIERLIKVTSPAKRGLIVSMLDSMVKKLEGLDAGYSKVKIQAFVQLAQIYHRLGIKDQPDILLSQAIQISSGIRLTELRANLLTHIALSYINIGQATTAQKILVQSNLVAQQFLKEAKNNDRGSRPFYFIAHTYAESGNFDREFI